MSSYADEGTIAHALAAMCLEEGKDASAYVGRIIDAQDYPHSKFSPSGASRWMECHAAPTLEGEKEFRERKFNMAVTDEMAEDVQKYVDAIRTYANGNQLFIEHRVDLSDALKLADQGGTSDVIILTDDEIQIHDLKFGRGVRVDAEENSQLMLYALGAYNFFGLLGEFKRIRVVIHQPRLDHLSEWDCTVDNVIEHGKRAAAAILSAQNFETINRTAGPNAGKSYFSPGEKQCRWCKAKATCPALAEDVSTTVFSDFEVIGNPHETATPVPLPAGAGLLASYMGKLELIEDWCRSVRAEVDRRLHAGDEVPGFKLVAGKKGNRAWADKAAVLEALKSMRLKHEQMYEYTLISPTGAEKLLKADSPKRWKTLQEHITQADGKPHVAPASDPRPALTVAAVADDFEAIGAQPVNADGTYGDLVA